MTQAKRVLADLRARGVALRVVGDRLRYRPSSAVPSGLKERMASCKEELLTLVEQMEERAAIMQFDGGLSRSEAERQLGLFPDTTEVHDPEASGSVGKRP